MKPINLFSDNITMRTSLIMIFYLLFALLCNSDARSRYKISLNWEKIIDCPNFINRDTDISKAQIIMVDDDKLGLKGTIDIKNDIDAAKIIANAALEKEYMGGNYISIISYNIVDLCDNIEKQNSSWRTHLEQLKPPFTKCPIKKNIHDVSHVQPQSYGDIEIREEMAGNYRVKIELLRQDSTDNGLPTAPIKWLCYMLKFRIDLE